MEKTTKNMRLLLEVVILHMIRATTLPPGTKMMADNHTQSWIVEEMVDRLIPTP